MVGTVRSSRLLALLLVLQRAGSSTAPRLAAEMEVSVRTIYRDVAALQAAGVPLYTAPGAGGGIHPVERRRSPVDGMTADEVRAPVVGGIEVASHQLAGVAPTRLHRPRQRRLPARLYPPLRRTPTFGLFAPVEPRLTSLPVCRRRWVVRG